MQTATRRSCGCHKLQLLKFVESCKRLFHYLGNCRVLKCITLWKTTTSDRIHYLNIRKQKSYKTFNILNIDKVNSDRYPLQLTNHLNTRFFISNAFFNSTSVLLNFLMNWASNVAYVLLNTFKHHHTETLIFTIFVAMSGPRSIYVVSVWSIFHFHLDLHYG